ncbi:Os04g0463600, partial [Oryza sativa Japonica Group]
LFWPSCRHGCNVICRAARCSSLLEGKMAGRARWVAKYTKGLVDVLHENNISHYRTQNGWRTDGWRKIVSEFNDRYPDAKFTKVQIQEHETQLKRDYRLVKLILQREGVTWDQNASMIRTTDEIWDEIIEEMPKARKYQFKSFPLLQSLEVLFEGDIPEGEHNLMPSKPQLAGRNVDEGGNNMSTAPSIPGRPCSTVIAGIDDGENNIGILQRTPELGQQGLDDVDILQNPTEEVLERPQHGADPKPQSADEPAHSSSCIEPQKDKRKKRKVPDIQQTMEAFLEFRMKQARLKEQAKKEKKDGEPFSISTCIKALHSMTDVSDQVKILASDVFKDAANREIFLSYDLRLRTLWIKREVNRLLT